MLKSVAMANDRFELFVAAQNPIFPSVEAELRGGRKQTHWMWFIFPQLVGLGLSEMSRRFGLASLEEAKAYLQHPILGLRLRDCTKWVLDMRDRDANQIFGSPDDLKFRSCMTLFSQAAPDDPLFRAALDHYFGGKSDPATIGLLRRDSRRSD